MVGRDEPEEPALPSSATRARAVARGVGVVLLIGASVLVTVTLLVVVAFVVLPPRSGEACERSDQSLVRDAGRGDTAAVRAALDDGADPNVADDHGDTPLGCALFRSRDETAVLLLDRQADPNLVSGQDAFAERPLELAVAHAAPATRLAVVEHGALPNAFTSSRHRPPLVEAIDVGDESLAVALVTRGADPNGTPGHRPLAVALDRDQLHLADALVVAGADVHLRDLPAGAGDGGPSGASDPSAPAVPPTSSPPAVDPGDLARDLARFERAPDVVDGALDRAAGDGRTATAVKAIELGADPNHDPYLAPLLRAAFFGHQETAVALLDHGADPNLGSADSLVLAFNAGRVPSPQVRRLLCLPAGSWCESLQVPDGTAPTPTLAPIPVDDPASLTSLVEPLAFDVPPLVAAVATGDGDMAELLLARGATPDQPAGPGWTALDLSAADCNVPMATLLLAHGAHRSAPGIAPDVGPVCAEVATLLPAA